MVARLLDIVGHHVFKGQHTLHIQIAGTGDEVHPVGILAGQLVTDEVATIVERFAVHKVILILDPAGGLDAADGAAFLCGHDVLTDAGHGLAAATQFIQFGIGFIGFGCEVFLREVGDIVKHRHIGFARIGRQLRRIHQHGGSGGRQLHRFLRGGLFHRHLRSRVFGGRLRRGSEEVINETQNDGNDRGQHRCRCFLFALTVPHGDSSIFLS